MEPEDQKLHGQITQRSTDANLGGDVHVPFARLYQVHEQARTGITTNPASASAQFVRTP